MPPRHQRLGRRLCWKSVSARAPRRDDDGAAHRTGLFRRAPGRLRVRAIRQPTLSASARMDEPPYEMNGSGMPFAGTIEITTLMLKSACAT